MKFERDVCVIGGCGHVGLPLSLVLADSGRQTLIYDLDSAKVEAVRSGRMPFMEEGGPEQLAKVLESGCLELTDRPDLLSTCEFLLVVIGTPVDDHLNPSFSGLFRCLETCRPYLRDGQVLILRSTLFPGMSKSVQDWLVRARLDVSVAFLPERVVQGRSLTEIRTLPQIASAFSPQTLKRAKALFAAFTSRFVEMAPMEAELCKLMTNAWRYLQFAIVNQFFMIASQNGLDFGRVLHGCRLDYPRTASMPGPGLSAGPCLFKDTMQLAAFSHNTFVLGHAAMLINEGLPAHLIELARRKVPFSGEIVAVIGMAFKAESDDGRESLSYKLRRLLQLEASEVLCSDPYVADDSFVSLETALARARVVFIGAPHAVYRDIRLRSDQLLVDVWNHVAQEVAWRV
jgi:UDP-N-acetyl-D-mannosaminuronic acid dehydrogenase